jgi:hypothetical protein
MLQQKSEDSGGTDPLHARKFQRDYTASHTEGSNLHMGPLLHKLELIRGSDVARGLRSPSYGRVQLTFPVIEPQGCPRHSASCTVVVEAEEIGFV